MSTTIVTGDDWTMTGGADTADEMLAALSTAKRESTEPKVLVKNGEKVEDGEEPSPLSKAASELGKAGAEARKKPLKPIPPTKEAADVDGDEADEGEKAKAKVDEEIQAAPKDKKKELASERILEATRKESEAKKLAEAAERRAAALERQLAALQRTQEQPAAKPEAKPEAKKAKPDLKDFQTYEDYTEALTDWKLDDRLATREKEQTERRQVNEVETQVQGWIDRHADRMTKAVEADEALRGVLTPEKYAGLPGHSSYWAQRAGKQVGPFNVIVDEIISSENGPRILAHLDQNPEALQRLMTLPNRRAIERAVMGLDARLEGATTGTSQPKRETSKASPPPTPVRGTPSAAEPDDESSYDDHVAFHNAKERRRR